MLVLFRSHERTVGANLKNYLLYASAFALARITYADSAIQFDYPSFTFASLGETQNMKFKYFFANHLVPKSSHDSVKRRWKGRKVCCSPVRYDLQQQHVCDQSCGRKTREEQRLRCSCRAAHTDTYLGLFFREPRTCVRGWVRKGPPTWKRVVPFLTRLTLFTKRQAPVSVQSLFPAGYSMFQCSP